MSALLLAQADARHLPLQDGSVHCVVTSPPYFGLRDYGTAQWVGGAPACDHTTARSRGDALHPGDTQGTSKGSRPTTQQVCARCGAGRIDSQIGLEGTLEAYLATLVQVFREVWRVLRTDGTLWLNIGDSYAGSGMTGGTGQATLPGSRRGQQATRCHAPGCPPEVRPKNLCMVPARVALALQADGWYLRSAITLCKRAPMPESVRDRPTSATEMLYLLTKASTYFYDAEAVRVDDGSGWHGSSFMSPYDRATTRGRGQQPRQEKPGRNLWNYWILGPEPTATGHYATFPTELVRRCLRAGTSAYGCCRACGAPWHRRVERHRVRDGHIPITGTFARPDEPFRIPPNGLGHSRYSTVTTEHGWHPTCACHAGTRPGVVLDPFCGSGTTLLVARELGRDAIGADLSRRYLSASARERLGLADLARWEGHASPPARRSYTDLPLFQKASPPQSPPGSPGFEAWEG